MESANALTTRQAAEILGVSVRTVQLWVEAGSLSAWKTPGGHRRVSRESVDRLLEKEGHTLAARRRPGPRVLVVEDNEQMQGLYRAAFDRWDLPVLIAGNGFEGLLLVGEYRPSVIIADLQMPQMDGFAMIRALVQRAELSDSLLLVVTGLTRDEIAARGGLPPEVPVLFKPVELELLRSIVFKQLALESGKDQ